MTASHTLSPARRRIVSGLGAAGLLAAAGWPAPGQAQSDRSVRFVLPNAAASGVDTITRAVAPALSRALGQPVVVENQPGAGGVVGLQTLSRAAPDGLTLSMVSNNVVTLPGVLKSMPFRMPDDFTPVAVVGHTPLVLVANPQRVPGQGSKEFVALLKARPDTYNFGSGGTGTILHLAAEMFLDEAGVTARHVPYKGVGQLITDLIGGQVDFAVLGLNSAIPHLKSKAVKAIGVSSAARSPAAPDIPTFVEQGLAGYVVDGWFAVLGPRGLPPAQLKRVRDALIAAFDAPEVQEAMAKQGNVVKVGTAEEAQAFFRSEVARFTAIARKAGVSPQ